MIYQDLTALTYKMTDWIGTSLIKLSPLEKNENSF